MEAKFEAPFPFWLDAGLHSSSKPSQRPPRNVAAFLAATSRLPEYQQDQLVKIKKLGSGTSFQVHACKDSKSGNLVVVKQLHTKQTSGELYDGAVLQELKVSVYPPFLKHENVVQTLGFLELDPGSVSLVLEYADHGSLAEYLADSSNSASDRDVLQRQNLIADICSGLEILHRCRVIHGDLKPDNILLFSASPSTGSPLVAKLTDFGSSIVEDTIYQDIDDGISSPIYRGTPVFVPGYLRTYSGRVPFHLMPAVEIYSFGLLLWSICVGGPYYLRLLEPGQKGIVDYLDSLGTEGFRQRFHADLGTLINPVDSLQLSTLVEAFNFCVRDVEIDHSPILPIDRERIYREAFSAISDVREILLRHVGNRLYHQNRTSLWQPFHLGSHPSKENVDQIPWHLQCELVQNLLDRLNDRQESDYERGKAALHLSSHYAVGLGCRKDNEMALHYIKISAKRGDNAAQLVFPRVFQAHGKLLPRLYDEDSSCADSETGAGDFEDSDADMEDLDEDRMEYLEDAYDTGSLESRDEPMPYPGGLESDMESTTNSDIDPDHVVFDLSAALDRETESNGDANPANYLWRKISMFERAMGYGFQAAASKYKGEWYGGLDDTNLVTALERTTVVSSEVPEVEIKCQDGTLIHSPALHHVVFCGMFKLAKQLIRQGWSPNAVNDDGDTLLHLAMRHGDVQMTEYLISSGVDIAVSNSKGVTPLHYLCMFGREAQDLQRDGNESCAEIDKLDEAHVAAFGGHDVRAIAKMIVDAGADVNASMGQFDSMVDAFFFHRISGTPLHAAVTLGNKAAVEALLELGADVDSRPFDDSDTPLELAAQLHLSEIAAVLLDHDASLRSASEQGTWAMHRVGSHVQPLTRWLLHGSRYKDAARDTIHVLMAAAEKESLSLDETDEAGLTAFTYALQESGEETYIVEAFLDCGARLPPNALSSAVLSCGCDELNASKVELVLQSFLVPGTTLSDEDSSLAKEESIHALYLAVSTGALAAVKAIINRFGSESLVHSQDDEGMTMLHNAVIAGDVNMATYILSQGSPINYRDQNGRTALATAIALGNEDLTSLLMLPTADLNIREGEYAGGTILHIAVSRTPRQSSMLAFLLSADLDETCDGPRFPQLNTQNILDAVDSAQGNTALHLAAYSGDYPGVFALLAAGATAKIKNSAGSTALDSVKERTKLFGSTREQPSNLEVVAALRKCAVQLECAKM